MKKVLLQENIWNEYSYDGFVKSFHDHGFEVTMRNIIPFTTEFTESLDSDYFPNFVFGSNRFVNICRQVGFPTFASFDPFEDFYEKSDYINSGKNVFWKDLKIDKPVFLKPYTEKFFTGVVVNSQEDLNRIQLSTSFIDDINYELIYVSDAVRIDEEIRYYVIGGVVITGSGYKLNGIGNHYPVDKSHPSYDALVKILNNRFIDDAFVIDVGRVNGEWKIVELNNINSSGLYKCDTDAIVNALKHL